MGLFSKKPGITDEGMKREISRIEMYSVHDPTLPEHLKKLKRYLKDFPQEKRDEYTDIITKKAKEHGVDFSSI
jgi:hypothetical protein